MGGNCIGVVGLGAMGMGMAKSLRRAAARFMRPSGSNARVGGALDAMAANVYAGHGGW